VVVQAFDDLHLSTLAKAGENSRIVRQIYGKVPQECPSRTTPTDVLAFIKPVVTAGKRYQNAAAGPQAHHCSIPVWRRQGHVQLHDLHRGIRRALRVLAHLGAAAEAIDDVPPNGRPGAAAHPGEVDARIIDHSGADLRQEGSEQVG
jgi:hypothetical protein